MKAVVLWTCLEDACGKGRRTRRGRRTPAGWWQISGELRSSTPGSGAETAVCHSSDALGGRRAYKLRPCLRTWYTWYAFRAGRVLRPLPPGGIALYACLPVAFSLLALVWVAAISTLFTTWLFIALLIAAAWLPFGAAALFTAKLCSRRAAHWARCRLLRGGP